MKNTEITTFIIKSNQEEFIRIKTNGDIYIKGKLSNNDKEIVDALREWSIKMNTNKNFE